MSTWIFQNWDLNIRSWYKGRKYWNLGIFSFWFNFVCCLSECLSQILQSFSDILPPNRFFPFFLFKCCAQIYCHIIRVFSESYIIRYKPARLTGGKYYRTIKTWMILATMQFQQQSCNNWSVTVKLILRQTMFAKI